MQKKLIPSFYRKKAQTKIFDSIKRLHKLSIVMQMLMTLDNYLY